MKFKFWNFKNFTLLFSKERLSVGRKNKKEQKVDSVKNTDSNSDKIDDGDQQRKVDSIILEERGKIIFLIIFYQIVS